MRLNVIAAGLLLACTVFLAVPDILGQQSYQLKHKYKIRLRTNDNKLQRGTITAINDSIIGINWHDSTVSYHYSEIKRVVVFRGGTLGKIMLVTVPAGVIAGATISNNKRFKSELASNLNNGFSVIAGLEAGLVSAPLLERLFRKRYNIAKNPFNFQRLISRIAKL